MCGLLHFIHEFICYSIHFAHTYIAVCEIYINMQVCLKNFCIFLHRHPSGAIKLRAHILLSICIYSAVHINMSAVHVWKMKKVSVCFLQVLRIHLLVFAQNLFVCQNMCLYMENAFALSIFHKLILQYFRLLYLICLPCCKFVYMCMFMYKTLLKSQQFVTVQRCFQIAAFKSLWRF